MCHWLDVTLIWFLLKENDGGRVNWAAAGSSVRDTVRHNAIGFKHFYEF